MVRIPVTWLLDTMHASDILSRRKEILQREYILWHPHCRSAGPRMTHSARKSSEQKVGKQDFEQQSHKKTDVMTSPSLLREEER